MKTFGKLSFGMSVVNLAKRGVVAEPELIANTTPGSFRLTAPVTRALGIASGDYVMFLDQDDLILKKALIKLYEKATQTNADIVVANGYRRWDKKYSPLYKRSMAQSLVSKEDVYIYGTDMIFSPGQCFVKRSAIPEEWKCNILKFLKAYSPINFSSFINIFRHSKYPEGFKQA